MRVQIASAAQWGLNFVQSRILMQFISRDIWKKFLPIKLNLPKTVTKFVNKLQIGPPKLQYESYVLLELNAL